MKKTLYLVTGAAGNLGNNVVRELVARGDDVRAFVLPGDPLADTLTWLRAEGKA